jgi:hypothetical protein
VDIQVDINEDLPPTEPLQIETKTADDTAEKLDLDAQLAMYSGEGSRVVIPGYESPNKHSKTDAEPNQKPDSISGAFLTPQNEAAKPTPITDISIDKGFLMTDSIKIRDGVRQGTLQSMLDDIGDPSSPIKSPQPDSPQKINPKPNTTQETATESKRYSIIVRNESGAPNNHFPIIDQPKSHPPPTPLQKIPEKPSSQASNNNKSENNKLPSLPPPIPQPQKPDTRDLATMLQSYEAKSTPPNPNPKNEREKNEEGKNEREKNEEGKNEREKNEEGKNEREKNQPEKNQQEKNQPEKNQPEKNQPEKNQPEKNQPEKNQPEKNQPEKNQPEKNQPEKNQPEKNQPEKNQPEKNQPEKNQPEKNQPEKNQETVSNTSNTQESTNQKTGTDLPNPFDSNTNALIEINTVD